MKDVETIGTIIDLTLIIHYLEPVNDVAGNLNKGHAGIGEAAQENLQVAGFFNHLYVI